MRNFPTSHPLPLLHILVCVVKKSEKVSKAHSKRIELKSYGEERKRERESVSYHHKRVCVYAHF
jgi:hypothetical protein